jgi:hypothetical protein
MATVSYPRLRDALGFIGIFKIQSIFQRLLGAGFAIMVATGGSWEPIGPIDDAVQMRNAIVVG